MHHCHVRGFPGLRGETAEGSPQAQEGVESLEATSDSAELIPHPYQPFSKCFSNSRVLLAHRADRELINRSGKLVAHCIVDYCLPRHMYGSPVGSAESLAECKRHLLVAFALIRGRLKRATAAFNSIMNNCPEHMTPACGLRETESLSARREAVARLTGEKLEACLRVVTGDMSLSPGEVYESLSVELGRALAKASSEGVMSLGGEDSTLFACSDTRISLSLPASMFTDAGLACPTGRLSLLRSEVSERALVDLAGVVYQTVLMLQIRSARAFASVPGAYPDSVLCIMPYSREDPDLMRTWLEAFKGRRWLKPTRVKLGKRTALSGGELDRKEATYHCTGCKNFYRDLFDSRAHQPALFQLDLRDLIQPLGECSPMFVIDSMSVTAYKQGTSERIPVKFAVLNSSKTRALTNDPCRLSSKWNVELGGLSSVKIAGTDKTPFHRSLTVYDEDNRQAMLNVLTFMMTEGLRASDDAKGSLDLLGAQCSNKDFVVDCERRGIESSARVVGSDTGNPTLRLCLCTDGYVCVPRRADMQREAQTHRSLIRLLRCAYRDNLDVIRKVAWFTDSVGCDRLYADDPDRISIPFQLMDFIVSFYRTLSEYADNFAVVHSKAPHVKVLIKSPSENVGYVTGSVTVTLLYGTSVLDVCYNMSAGVRDAEEGEELDLGAAVAQLGYDTLIRRFPLRFKQVQRDMSLKDWCAFHHGETSAAEHGSVAPSLLLSQMY
ncbi:hypothetical protein Q5P01_005409 [Channa striata]|uniref:Uncharacterized protein n=1 Tax=Channa striata TaxID=64152 RepID=A0AA88SZG5_CHASR|nr:hypothetical protein Q5P01_005409 [Channa striata]